MEGKEPKNAKVRKFLWVAIFITNILAIVLLLISTQAGSVLPSKAPLVSILGMAFPVLVVMNFLYLLFWIFTLKWVYIGVQIVVLLFCWDSMHTYMPMNKRSEQIPEASFKIMSYNVRHFNWLTGKRAKENPIFDYILAQEADIICLQEFGAVKKKTSKGQISKEEIDEKFKAYPYKEVVQLGRSNRSQSLYGLAIYSKYPIKRTVKIPFESTYNGCAFHEIEIGGKLVTVVNTHLETNKITSDDKKLYKDFLSSDKDIKIKDVTENIKSRLSVAFTIREEQTQIIRDYMDKIESDAIVVCGDFNDTPMSYAYKTMKGDLVDSFVATGRGLGITYHENMFLFRIDYILHSITLKSYNTTVGEEEYSDHYPVWSHLMFK